MFNYCDAPGDHQGSKTGWRKRILPDGFDAVRQFDDIATTGKIEALNEMIALYKKYQQDLSWLGGNFNQAMKRANELAIGDMLNKKYYEKVILPQCTRIMDLIAEIKSEQHEIARKLIKV